jgi:SAM-dependent methyltransferase
VGQVSFEVAADVYCRFMARYSEPLAVQFADLAGVLPGQRALDVGCGPGALTAELVRRLGTSGVCAVDPSESFVRAAGDRLPGLDVQRSAAEQLPFADDSFDVTLAQLVVQFMTDPVAGVREMARVTRPGGIVAACVWDRAGGRSPTTLFWQAAHELDPAAYDGLGAGPGVSGDDLSALLLGAGLAAVRPAVLTVQAPKVSFDEWWEPFLAGAGPPGDYVLSLDHDRRAVLRDRCQRLFAAQPDTIAVAAWAVAGQVSR